MKRPAQRWLAMLLTVAMVMSFFPASAFSTEIVVAELTATTSDGTTTTEHTSLAAAIAAASSTDTVTLLADAEITETLTISNAITLDLAGFDITASTTGFSVITVDSNGALTLKDSTTETDYAGTPTTRYGYWDDNDVYQITEKHPDADESGTIADGTVVTTITGGVITGGSGTTVDKKVYGGGVYVNGGSFTMNGGTIAGNTIDIVADSSTNTYAYGGGVYVSDGSFAMNGGTIAGNALLAKEATTYARNLYGGGVYVASGVVTFTMAGGSIVSNAALASSATTSTYTNTYGGGVYTLSDFTMTGGSIADNTLSAKSGSEGGGVYVGSGANFTMQGSTTITPTITGNTIPTTSTYFKGGGVYMGGGTGYTFTMTDSEISGNTGAYGGGVYVSSGNFTMTDSTISSNTVASWGGGVYVINSNSTFTMTDSTISKNSAQYGGGVYVNYGTFVMEGGTIGGSEADANEATSNGGGVYNKGTATMKASAVGTPSISYNQAATSGGGVYVAGSSNAYASFTIEAGEISNNTVGDSENVKSGGGVYLSSYTTLTMNGGSIAYNTATGSSGGVYLASTNATLTMNAGSITNNSAGTYGGGVYLSSSSATLTMNAGSITSNNAGTNGGGVYLNNGTANVSGAVDVTGNTSGSGDDKTTSNVYLISSKTITIAGVLDDSASKEADAATQTASIGVTTANTPTEGSPVNIAALGTDSGTTLAANVACFSADIGSTYTSAVNDTDTYIQLVAPHVHSWVYTNPFISSEPSVIDTTTIVATCSDANGTCDVTDGSITIKAPTEQTYTGEAIAATLENYLDESITVPTILYYTKGDDGYSDTDTGTETAPTNVGTYKAVITLGADANGENGVSAYVEYTIEAATITVTPTVGQSKYYGQTDGTLDYTSDTESVTLTGTLERVAGESTGTYAINAGSLASADANYYVTVVTGVTYEIKAYTPDATVEDPTGWTNTDELTLTAPTGYTISLNGTDFAESVTIATVEGEDNTEIYYLKANDGGAVSTAQTFTYSNDQTTPVLVVTPPTTSGETLVFDLSNDSATGQDSGITYSVSPANGASVDGDALTIRAAGTYTITATSGAGLTHTQAVTVCSVTFTDNVLSTSTATALVVNGNKVTQPTPTQAGYTFAGWVTADGGSTEFAFDTAITANIELYATWSLNDPSVDVSVGANGSSVSYGNTVTLTATPTHAAASGSVSYTYQWYKKGESASVAGSDTLTLANVAESGDYYVVVTATGTSGLTATATSDETSVTITQSTTQDAATAVEAANTNGWYSTSSIAIEAPAGYTISTSDALDGNTWGGSITITTEEKENAAVTYYLKADDSGAISAAKTFTYSNDQTAPTGTITIGENVFIKLLNIITFNMFFHNTVQVTISGSDALSSVDTIEYQKVASAADFDQNSTTAWEESASFFTSANDQFAVYARITDNAGNVTIINSDGVTVYTESAAATTSFDFVKADGAEAVIATVTTNGNTIKAIALGETTLTLGADYTLSTEENDETSITFSATYLAGLTRGENKFTISYNPMGVNIDEITLTSDSDVPTTTAITACVYELLTDTTASVQAATYDGEEHSIVASATSEIAGADISIGYADITNVTNPDLANVSYSSANPIFTNAGTYVVAYQVQAAYHEPITGTVTLTISPKAITGAWTNTTTTYNGTAQCPTMEYFTGVVGEGTVTASCTGATNAGSYTSVATLSNSNYTLTNPTASFTIAKVAVSFAIISNAADGTVGEVIASYTSANGTTATLTAGDDFTVSYVASDGTIYTSVPTQSGSYSVVVTIDEAATGGNYRVTGTTASSATVGTYTVGVKSYTATFGTSTVTSLAGAQVVVPTGTDKSASETFLAWYYNGKTYQPGDTFTQPSSDITFTATYQKVYEIDGAVTQAAATGDETALANATVTLMYGSETIAETVTDASGSYSFVNVPAGTYNIVVTYDGVTRTAMVTIDTAAQAGETVSINAIVMPAGATSSVVEVTAGTPGVVVGGLDSLFDSTVADAPDPDADPEDDTTAASAANDYTNADAAVVQGGGSVELKLVAEEVTDKKSVDEIETQADNVGMYIDIDIIKTVTGLDQNGVEQEPETSKVTETSELLTIIIPIPAELQGKASYTIYRQHEVVDENGNTTYVIHIITTAPNDYGEYIEVNTAKTEITLYAKYFSTYAIAYEEYAAPETPTTPDDGDDGVVDDDDGDDGDGDDGVVDDDDDDDDSSSGKSSSDVYIYYETYGIAPTSPATGQVIAGD